MPMQLHIVANNSLGCSTQYPPDWFQPWPRDALFSVGRKFLSEMDLGSDGIRAAIERFLPLSFKVVNTAAEAFKTAERRWA